MRNVVSFLILAVFCIGSIFVCFHDSSQIVQSSAASQKKPGVYALTREVGPFMTNTYLAGEWEYYPKRLYFSPFDDKIDGKIDGFNAMQMLDYKFWHPAYYEIRNKYALDHTSTIPNTEARHIFLPSAYRNAGDNLNALSVASYRLIVKGIQVADDAKMTLSFYGIANSNTRVYINGRPVSTMISPWNYPSYQFSGSEAEIVIETSNASGIFNLTPRIAYIGHSMAFFDGCQNLFLIFSAALIAALIILIFTNFSLEPKRFRLYFWIGLIFTLYYVFGCCWVSGYLDMITGILPLFLIGKISHLMALIGGLMVFYTLYKYHPGFYSKKMIRFIQLTTCGIFAMHILAIFNLQPRITTFIGHLLYLVMIIFWLIRTIQTIAQASVEQILFQDGVLLLMTAAIGYYVNNQFGIASRYIFLMPALILTYTIMTFVSASLYQKQLLTRTRELLKIEKEMSRVKTAMLSSQIKPHFLYNTLTTIQEFCYTEPEKAADLIVHFSKYLRNNIDFMDYTELIPFARELDHINNYMYIQTMRFDESLIFETDIRTMDFEIPPLSIQPLVENAVNYGYRRSINGGTIQLAAWKDDQNIHIRVTNTGPGFDPARETRQHSLYNIQNRINNLLHGSMTIQSEEGKDGTQVDIVIPVED